MQVNPPYPCLFFNLAFFCPHPTPRNGKKDRMWELQSCDCPLATPGETLKGTPPPPNLVRL